MAKSKNALTIYETGEIKNLSDIATPPPALLEQQLLHLLRKTPKEHIYQRPGKGGGKWDFVTGTYVKKVLNYVFGWDWDFEVKEHGNEGEHIWVLGKLTVRGINGRTITKEQFGRAEAKKKGTGGYLDYGNDLKAATTDALKKCASELGIASDIYGKQEFKEIELEAKPVKEDKPDDADLIDDALKTTLTSLKIDFNPEITTKGEARELIKQYQESKK